MVTAFALKGLAAVLSFTLNWLIARKFGPAGVGTFGVFLTTAVLTSTIALAGLDVVLVRTVAIERAAGRTGVARTAVVKIVGRAIAVSLTLALLLWLVRPLTAGVLINEPALASVLGVIAFAIPIITMSKLAAAGLRGVDRIAMSQSLDGPVGTGFAAIALGVVIFAGIPASPVLPTVLYCVFWGLAGAIGWLAFGQSIRKWDPAEPFDGALYRAGLPILCAALSLVFIDWFVTLLLSSTRSAAEAGLFRLAFQIVATVNLIIAASESILGPVIAASYDKGDKQRIASISRLAGLGILAASSPLLAAFFFAPHFVMSLFGPEFRAGAQVLQILALGQTVNLLTGPVGTILVMTKHERWLLAYSACGALLAAILGLALIPAHGVNGAAIAVAATIVFRNLAALLLVRVVVGINFFTRGKP
jgi:O-antigen/teichoic acid export membrane protein